MEAYSVNQLKLRIISSSSCSKGGEHIAKKSYFNLNVVIFLESFQSTALWVTTNHGNNLLKLCRI